MRGTTMSEHPKQESAEAPESTQIEENATKAESELSDTLLESVSGGGEYHEGGDSSGV